MIIIHASGSHLDIELNIPWSEPLKPDNSDQAEQISDHDGTMGFIDMLQKKTKGKPSVDIRLDMKGFLKITSFN